MPKRPSERDGLTFMEACSVLRVNPQLDAKELVKEANQKWRKESLCQHPDKNPGSTNAHEDMQRINAAREAILKEASVRQRDKGSGPRCSTSYSEGDGDHDMDENGSWYYDEAEEAEEGEEEEEQEQEKKRRKRGCNKESDEDLDKRMMMTLTSQLVKQITEKVAQDVRHSDSAKAATLERLLKASEARRLAQSSLRELEKNAAAAIEASETDLTKAKRHALEGLRRALVASGSPFSPLDFTNMIPGLRAAEDTAYEREFDHALAQFAEMGKVDEALDDIQSLFKGLLSDLKDAERMEFDQALAKFAKMGKVDEASDDIKRLLLELLSRFEVAERSVNLPQLTLTLTAIEAFLSATGEVGSRILHFLSLKLPFSVLDEDHPDYNASMEPTKEDKRNYFDAEKKVFETWQAFWSEGWTKRIGGLLLALREMQNVLEGRNGARLAKDLIVSIDTAVERKRETEDALSQSVAAKKVAEATKQNYHAVERTRREELQRVSGWQSVEAKEAVVANEAAKVARQNLKSLCDQYDSEIKEAKRRVEVAEDEEFKAANEAADQHFVVDDEDSSAYDSFFVDLRSKFLDSKRSPTAYVSISSSYMLLLTPLCFLCRLSDREYFDKVLEQAKANAHRVRTLSAERGNSSDPDDLLLRIRHLNHGCVEEFSLPHLLTAYTCCRSLDVFLALGPRAMLRYHDFFADCVAVIAANAITQKDLLNLLMGRKKTKTT